MDEFSVTCPHCGWRILASASMADEMSLCPKCSKAVVLLKPETVPHPLGGGQKIRACP